MNFNVKKDKMEVKKEPITKVSVKPTSSAKIEYFEEMNGHSLVKLTNEFGEKHNVIATQTGYLLDKTLFYAFVFYKN